MRAITAYLICILSILSLKESNAQCAGSATVADTLFPVINLFRDTTHNGYFSRTKSQVKKLAKKDSTLYIFGDFDNLAVNRGTGLVFDSTSRQLRSAIKDRINGPVFTSLPDGQGGFYIAGSFTKIGSTTTNRIARINQRGEVVPLNLQFNDEVYALFNRGDTLFIGGRFTKVNNADRTALAIYSLSGDSLLLQKLNLTNYPPQRNQITKFIPFGDKLFLGGFFVNASGIQRPVRQYDSKNLALTSWQLAPPIFSEIEAMDISTDGSTLFINVDYAQIAAINTTSGAEEYRLQVSIGGIHSPLEGFVKSIEAVGNNIYVAGIFENAFHNGTAYPRRGLFVFDENARTVLPTNLNLDHYAEYVELHKDKIYLSGTFRKVQNITAEHFAIIDSGTLAVEQWNFFPTDPALTTSISGGSIFVGGYFQGIHAKQRYGMAAVDLSTDSILPFSPGRPSYSEIRRIIPRGDTIFVLGHKDDDYCDNIYNVFEMYHAVTGARIVPPVMNFREMDDFTIDGNYLYASVDDKIQRFLLPSLSRDVTWQISFEWGATAFKPLSLHIQDQKLIAAGGSRCNDGVKSAHLAIINPANAQLLNYWEYDPQPNRPNFFHNVVQTDSLIFVRGIFHFLNGIERGHIAQINIQNGNITPWKYAGYNVDETPFVPWQLLSDFKLWQGKLWTSTGKLDTTYQKSEPQITNFKGFVSIDTSSGILLPPFIKPHDADHDNGAYSSLYYGGTLGYDVRTFQFNATDLVVGGRFDYVNGETLHGLARLKYDQGTPPSSAAVSIIGPSTFTPNSEWVKYYVPGGDTATLSYSWVYTGTGVTIRNNGKDTVWLKFEATATPGDLKLRSQNYCGYSPEAVMALSPSEVDLTITALSAPATVPTGSSFTASFTEDNLGSASAAFHRIYFYLSADAILTPGQNGDTFLGEHLLSSLGAGANTGSINKTFVMPCVMAGDYYLIAKSDGKDSIPETSEVNNTRTTAVAVTTGATYPGTPSITASPGGIVCDGTVVTLTANSTGCTNCTYTWNTNPVSTGPSISVTTSGTYQVTASNACGSASASRTVTIRSNPVITVSAASSTICEGSSTQLTATGGVSYTWSPATGLSATTGAVVTASPAVTTTYTVTGVYSGCSSSAQITITVQPKPIVSVSPADTSICSGTTVTLTASGATTYSWSPSSGLNTTSGALVVASPATTTTYTVAGTSNGCTTSLQRTITILPRPTLSLFPNDTTICAGSSVVMTASGAADYAWSPATGLSATTGASVTASPATSTTYTLTGTAANTCTSTLSRAITVVPAVSPTISISYTGCPSNSLVFTSTISNGGSQPVIDWYVNNIKTFTGASFTLNNVTNGTQVYAKLTSNAQCPNPATVNSAVTTVNCITTSLPAIDALTALQIAPNPNNGVFEVTLKLSGLKQVSLFVSDALGNAMYQTLPKNTQGEFSQLIDLRHLPPAVYYLTINIGDQIVIQKIVKL